MESHRLTAAGQGSDHSAGASPEPQSPPRSGNLLRYLSMLSLISNVMVLILMGPLMGWVCGRLKDVYARMDMKLPSSTIWFLEVSWTKVTLFSILLAVLLLMMERNVRPPGLTLAVHLIVTVAVGVLIVAFIIAMYMPLIGMLEQ